MQVLFSPMAIGWTGGQAGEKRLSGQYLETMRCSKLKLSKDIGWGCVGVQRHGVTFDLALVTLSLKILSGLYLRNCKM